MNIAFQPTDKVLSTSGGLEVFSRLMKKTKVESKILPCLPLLKSGLSRSATKFRNLLLGFAQGATCLDDMERCHQDRGFHAVVGGRDYSAKSYGDFLRDFKKLDIRRLNHQLVELGYELRRRLSPKNMDSITFDLDSTTNEQHGSKIEGTAYNYKGQWGLDTIKCFDEWGFQYWHDVRPGNTFSSQGSGEILHEVFSRMPKSKEFFKLKRYARADSAFCNQEFFSSCFIKGVKFVVAMRHNMLEPLLDRAKNWAPCGKKLVTPLYDGRDCEISEFKYTHEDTGRKLRVVVLRAVKAGSETPLFSGHKEYDYYSWVTNIFEHEMSKEELVLFYRKRGMAENFIRELKHNFDLKHYPCLSLDANRSYGLIAAYAYNLIRAIALIDCSSKPQFAKAIRYRFFNLPVQIIRTGGQVIFRLMKHHYEEVTRIQKLISVVEFGFT
jgi:hypothetical protein